MLVRVLVSVVVSVYILFVEGFVDRFEVFNIEECKVFDT